MPGACLIGRRPPRARCKSAALDSGPPIEQPALPTTLRPAKPTASLFVAQTEHMHISGPPWGPLKQYFLKELVTALAADGWTRKSGIFTLPLAPGINAWLSASPGRRGAPVTAHINVGVRDEELEELRQEISVRWTPDVDGSASPTVMWPLYTLVPGRHIDSTDSDAENSITATHVAQRQATLVREHGLPMCRTLASRPAVLEHFRNRPEPTDALVTLLALEGREDAASEVAVQLFEAGGGAFARGYLEWLDEQR